jgi:hypothetical protein
MVIRSGGGFFMDNRISMVREVFGFSAFIVGKNHFYKDEIAGNPLKIAVVATTTASETIKPLGHWYLDHALKAYFKSISKMKEVTFTSDNPMEMGLLPLLWVPPAI